MKKIFRYVFIITFLATLMITPAFSSDETDVSFTDDAEWSEMMKFDREWRTNQEAVTDKEFEDVMQRFEKKKKYKKYEFEPDEKRDMMNNDMSVLTSLSTRSKTIQIPTDFRTYEGVYIPAGYYTATYSCEGNKHYLTMSQGRTIYAKIVLETSKNTYKDEEDIHFIKIIKDDNDDSMRIIYGDIDLNLEKKLYAIH